MRILVRLSVFEVIPRGFGVVCLDACRNRFVCAPMPLNLVLRLLYLVHGYLLYPLRGSTWWERKVRGMRTDLLVHTEEEFERRVAREVERRRGSGGGPA